MHDRTTTLPGHHTEFSTSSSGVGAHRCIEFDALSHVLGSIEIAPGSGFDGLTGSMDAFEDNQSFIHA